MAAGNHTVPDLGEDLLHMGPHEVGYTSFTITDNSRGNRPINLMIWYPAEISTNNPAVYKLILPITLPPPSPPTPIFISPGKFDASYFAEFVEGLLVRGGPPVEAGEHPVFIHLPGGGAPGAVYIYEGVKFASHGFIFVSVTHLISNTCDLDLDAKLVLDELMARNETAGNLFYHTIDPEAIFGGGHSIGGRTWIAMTSDETECGLSREDRMEGLALKDPTREALTETQVERNFTPTFLNSQFCRNTQIALQQEYGFKPMMLTLEGACSHPDNINHSLFSQNCMTLFAGKNSGTVTFPTPLPVQLLRCISPTEAELARCPGVVNYVAKETFFAQETTKFDIAYLETLLGEKQFQSVLAPGRVNDPGVFLIRTPIGAGGDAITVLNANQADGAEGFCTQAGTSPGENPLVEFNLPGFP